MSFTFDYGEIVIKPRFSISRAIDDYPVTVLLNCISVSLVYCYKTMACDKLIAEIQIIYRVSPSSTALYKFDLHDYSFEVVKKGDMSIRL